MWINKIKPLVFSELKKRGTERMSGKTEYANAFFTTSSKVQTQAKFPAIYLEQLQGSSQGDNLEKGVPNAIMSTFQITTTDNVSQNRADEVADIMADIMCELGYTIISSPTPIYSQDTYQNVSRYRRIIGSDEVIILK